MEMDSEDQDMAYRSLVGERIRSIRKQKRLSLQEVEARSEAEFKASVPRFAHYLNSLRYKNLHIRQNAICRA